jgi:hypothetical protein
MMRKYEMTETWPCPRCCVTPVTFVPDGKAHHCQPCIDEIEHLADEFWATMDMPVPSVSAPPAWTGRRR